MIKHREEQTIITFQQILKKNFPINKATTIGIVIDATSVYKNKQRNLYLTRLKIIDHKFNFNSFNPYIQSKYLTAYFQSNLPTGLPRPRFIGDIVYLRRFKFNMYNQQLQAFQYNLKNNKKFSNWYLISGDFHSQDCLPYATNRENLTLKDYQNVFLAVKHLRQFSKEYQANQSIMSLFPRGFYSKDSHYVVKMLKRSPEGYFLDINGDQVFLPYIQSEVQQNSLAKLVNVVRIENKNGWKQVICNKYTSLIAIYQWSYDAKRLENISKKQDQEEQIVFTKLSPLTQVRLLSNNQNVFNIKVQIADMQPPTFKQAIQYRFKSELLSETEAENREERQEEPMELVYNIKFICMDEDFHKTHQFYQIFLYSQNQMGGNLIQKINLQEIGPYSSYLQQSILYKQKREQLLNSKLVKMKVQILEDENMNRIFRLVDIYNIQ